MRELKGKQAATLRAQWLGHQLRELREQRGMTLKQAAEYLKRNFSALSRFENAEWPIPAADVELLLTLYGVADKEVRARYLQLCDEVWRKDEWVDEYADVIYDRSFVDLPWLEQRAERICSFDLTIVHGLLQTPEYAEALIRYAEGPKARRSQVAKWVELRLDRQATLQGARPTRFSCVIAEPALRNPVGGAAVMRAQLEHLGQLARKRHIEVRVLPANVGPHAGLDGSFRIFELPQPYPKVAYVETLAGRLFLEAPKSDRFVHAYDRLREAALSPAESARLVAAVAVIAEEMS